MHAANSHRRRAGLTHLAAKPPAQAHGVYFAINNVFILKFSPPELLHFLGAINCVTTEEHWSRASHTINLLTLQTAQKLWSSCLSRSPARRFVSLLVRSSEHLHQSPGPGLVFGYFSPFHCQMASLALAETLRHWGNTWQDRTSYINKGEQV